MVRPIGDRVLVSVAKPETKTSSGIIIANAAEKTNVEYGIVEAVGSKVTEDVLNKKVVFEKYSGVSFRKDERDYVLLKTENILAVEE